MTTAQKFQNGLGDPGTELTPIRLTPEVKERINRACYEMIEELVKRTEGPAEAYLVLDHLKSSFEEIFGITGGMFVTKDQTGKT